MKSLRVNRLKGKFHLTKAALVCLAIVVAFGSLGVTYAYRWHRPQVRDYVYSNPYNNWWYNYFNNYSNNHWGNYFNKRSHNCGDNGQCAMFTWVVSNDDGTPDDVSPYGIIDPGDVGGGTEYDKWGASSSDDPSAPPPGIGQGCDREKKDVAITTADKLDEHNIQVTIDTAYPSYHPTIFYGIKNVSIYTAEIKSIEVDEDLSDEDPKTDIPELTTTVTGISEGQMIAAGEEVVGDLHIHVEQCAAQNHTYTIKVKIVIECLPTDKECGTAYAYCDDSRDCDDCDDCDDSRDCDDCDDDDDCPGCATCFTDIYWKFPWGWTNGPLGPGSYEFPIYASAAKCNISKGTLVGTLTVDYDGSTATVTYTMNAGFTMDETQLYVGSDILPKKNGDYTVSPGQYPYQHVPVVDPTTDTYTISGLSGPIYVVAHAVACWLE